MPFIGAAIVGAIGLSGFVATATSALINLGVAAGLSYLSRSMLGATATTDTGIKTNIELGGNQPRGCIFGETGTAGQLIYWNTANENNNYLQMIFALGEGPHEDLTRIWVNGKERTLTLTASTAWSKTYRVSGFTTESGVPVLYVDFYYGYEDQPYDADLVDWAKPTSRWTSADRLAGVCYAKVRAFYIDTAFDTGGVPTFLFGVKGRRVYDWRKDSTNGGSGAHRWNDAHTWEYSANPIVHLYNFQRGLTLGGELIVGMGVPPIDLRLDMYTAAANVCDTLVADPGGVMGPAFACNTVVSANEEYGSVIQRLLDSCAGSLYERVGAYGPIAGAGQSVIYPTITDGDLVVGRPVKFTAKLSRADLINGVFGSYVSPDDQYQMVSYPARTDSGAEAADTEIRRIQQDEPTITSSGMAQRLAQIRLELARLQSTATITLGFRAIVLEPGDWVRWNSARYGDRTYIILSLTQNTDQTVTVNLREIAASAFAWSAGDELPAGDPGIEGDTSGLATGVTGFSLSALTLTGAGGAKTPAIRVFWSPISDPTITAVVIEYRIAGTTDALSISTSSVGNGEYLISAGLVPNTAYELRAGIVTFPARATEWTGWSTISTAEQLAGGVVPDSVTPEQFTAATRDLVVAKTAVDIVSLQYSVERLSLLLADVDAAGDLNRLKLTRTLVQQLGAATARFSEEITAATGPESALVQQITDLQASLETADASLSALITTESTTRATADDALAVQISTLQSTMETADASLSASITSEAGTRASADSALSSQITTLQSSMETADAALSASITSEAGTRASADSALATQIETLEAALGDVGASLAARFVVAVTPSGAIAAYELEATAETAKAGFTVVAKSDGAGGAIGEVHINADRFFITAPDLPGTAVFLVDNTGPEPVLYLNGDLIASGSITAAKLDVAELSAIVANLGEITAGIARSADNRLRIDFDNARIVISS